MTESLAKAGGPEGVPLIHPRLPDPRRAEAPLIDVRPEAAFVAGHAPGAAGLPAEELPRRAHELPAREAALRVTDADAERAARAAQWLRGRGHAVEVVPWGALAADERGRALDLACGSGREAVYLALRGYEVEAIDVLPDALERAADLAARNGVRLVTHCRDLGRGPALPAGRFDLVCVFRFLRRDLFGAIASAVAPGGFVAYETFHRRNLATGRRPTNPAHLLEGGELARAFGPAAGFEIVLGRDGFEREGRFFSNVLARRGKG